MLKHVLFLASCLASLWIHGETVDLTRVRIRVGANAPTNVAATVAELEKHLALVAGARTPASDGYEFVLGERPAGTPPPGAFESCVRVAGGRLYFWGDENVYGLDVAQGTRFAVYEFLEKALGVDWAFPGDAGIVVRPRQTLDLAEGQSWRFVPPFAIAAFRVPNRASYNKYVRRFVMPEEFRTPEDWWWRWRADIATWYDRMRICSTNTIFITHSFGDWQKRYLKDHPDWFAYVTNPEIRRTDTNCRGVVDKEAGNVQFCVSNPEVPGTIVADWQSRGAPRDLSIGPNDGKYCFCHCTNCLALDTRRADETFFDHLTDRYVQFYNRIAAKAVAVRPDVRIGAYAYSAYEKPPRREKLAFGDNFVFSVVPVFGDDFGRGDGFGKVIDGWKAVGLKNFYVRPNYMWYCPAVPRGIERFLYDHVRMARAKGTLGFSFGCWPRPLTDFEYYTLASLLRDPTLGFETIAARFYAQYGAAAPEARAYFERVRARSPKMMTAMTLATNRALDDSALAIHAFDCVTSEELAGDLPLLKPGIGKPLAPAERKRFAALCIRARHAILTQRFMEASKGADEAAFQAAAKTLHDFRVQHFAALGYEGGAWHSTRNAENKAWARTPYLPQKK